MFLSGMLAWGRRRVKTSPRRSFLRRVRWISALVWMGGIFFLSQQSSPSGGAGGVESEVAHVVLYAALASLLFWALAGDRSDVDTPFWVPAALAFALTVLYGVSDELHQAFVPARTASELDVALDAAGAALGVAVALLASRFLTTRQLKA